MLGTPNLVAIVHGKSEGILVKGLGMSMNLRVLTFSRNGGNENIAMSALPSILARPPFDSETSLHREYTRLDYRPRKVPRIPGLGLYPVMDHDGDDRNLRSYISGDLFRGCPLGDRVVPIINIPNLDAVMESMGYGRPKNKTDFYHELVDRDCDVEEMYDDFRKCGNSNMDVLIHRLMVSSPGFQGDVKKPTGLFRRGSGADVLSSLLLPNGKHDHPDIRPVLHTSPQSVVLRQSPHHEGNQERGRLVHRSH